MRWPITLLLVCWLAGAAPASGQVLLTGEPGGAGAQSVAVTANLISPKDFGNLTNFWALYGFGLTDRVDLFASYGAISVFGETQHYAGVGSNIGVLRRNQHGLDVSVMSGVTAPLSRRGQAATLLGTIAVIASRPVTIGSLTMTPYGGFESVVPIGGRARGVFTPVETLHAGIAGVAIPLQKTWTAYVEYNPGPNLRSGGAGVVVMIPRRQP
jgi:hypothetical protein